MQETLVQLLGQEDPLEKGQASHSIFSGFPGGPSGKESPCNVGDLASNPGLGRSPGEGNGYPLQYSDLENSMDCIVHAVAKSRTQLKQFHFHQASLVAQWVKSLSARKKTQGQSWVSKILWRRKWQPTPIFLPGEFHGQRSIVGYSPWDHKDWDTTECLSLQFTADHDNLIINRSKIAREPEGQKATSF